MTPSTLADSRAATDNAQVAEPDKKCQNCDSLIPPGGRYCPACGQSVLDVHQPWWPMFKQLVIELFDWDGRMLTSLKLLMLYPGQLTLEFTRGRRRNCTPPVRLYLVVSLLFFFVFPLIMPESRAESPRPPEQLATENYSRMMFILLPVFALFVKLFHPKQYYLQHLVFSMHLFAAMFLVFALMLSMENLADQNLVWMAAQVVVFGYMVWYALAALKVAYEQSWLTSFLKFLGLVALFLPTLAGGLELASHL